MSFQIVKVIKFPNIEVNKALYTSDDLSLPGYQRNAETSIKLITSCYNGFKLFNINHEIYHKEDGIAFGMIEEYPDMHEMRFSSYLKPYSFFGYYDESEQLFYIESQSFIIKSFLKNIDKHKKDIGIEFENITIDLEKLIQLVPDVAAVWLKGNSSKIKSIGMFGSDVCHDQDYEHLQESKSLSSIVIDPVINGVVRRLNINTNTCFYIQEKIDDRDELLRIAKSFKKDYIEKIALE
jgi:hypothetical protein